MGLPGLPGFKRETIKRKFPIATDIKYRSSTYDPNSPYIPKGQYAVATRIVALDGSGDFEDIQSAINDLPSGGGAVYIKEGTYTISSSISITKSNVALIGSGAATIIYGPISASIIHTNGYDQIYISNLKILGINSVQASNTGINLLSSDDSMIEGCWIEDCGRSGIRFASGSRAIINRNIVLDNKNSYGIVLDQQVNSIISNNIVKDSASSGIALVSSHRTLVTNNTLSSNTTFGIVLSTSEEITVSNNIVKDSTSSGIYLDQAHRSIISNNTSSQNVRFGIALSNSDDCLISSNICVENDYNNSTSYDGIRIDMDSDNCIVMNNRCKDNDEYEIAIATSTCHNTILLGNNLVGSDHFGSLYDAGTDTQIGHNITN